MSSLLVVRRSFAAFHHEWGIRLGEIGEDRQVEGGSKVVGVGYEHVFVSVLEQRVEAA